MSTLRPAINEFIQLAERQTHVPVVATLVCDDMTPLSAFARLQQDADRAFLLESVVGGETVARYSFLGAHPRRSYVITGERLQLIDHLAHTTSEQTTDDPLRVLEEDIAQVRVPTLPGLPRFLGGAVGYAGYDTIRYYERLPDAPADDRGLPDLLFDVYDTMVAFDHVHKVVLVVALADLGDAAREDDRRKAYELAAERIAGAVERLTQPSSLRPARISLPVEPLERYASSIAQSDFERIVERCKEYIRAGDIFQVVPSQRLLVETQADPLNIYRALRVINPSPFMFYVKAPQVTLAGASPEIMCRVEDGVVTNRPLAGTRPRGATPTEDERLRDDLLADPKERAEHVMLVDLGRNDVGRVARPAGVHLSKLMNVEYYSHVMHISSTVTGELAENKTAFDALRATLPVGTVSGAPKVRAMQIIDEVEPTRRGPYAGAVGYIDYAGNMDTCIALRTLVAQPGPDGTWRDYIQVGAGIVADSVPEREFQETLNKAKSLLSAIRAAEEQFAE